jgi:hypothetical protein
VCTGMYDCVYVEEHFKKRRRSAYPCSYAYMYILALLHLLCLRGVDAGHVDVGAMLLRSLLMTVHRVAAHCAGALGLYHDGSSGDAAAAGRGARHVRREEGGLVCVCVCVCVCAGDARMECITAHYVCIM